MNKGTICLGKPRARIAPGRLENGMEQGPSTKSNSCYTFSGSPPRPSFRDGGYPIDTKQGAIDARPAMVNPELLEILVCPETKQTLVVADDKTLEMVAQAVEGGSLHNQGGDRVKDRIEEGLVREDGAVLYPVQDDIPVMLLDEAIRLDSLQ